MNFQSWLNRIEFTNDKDERIAILEELYDKGKEDGKLEEDHDSYFDEEVFGVEEKSDHIARQNEIAREMYDLPEYAEEPFRRFVSDMMDIDQKLEHYHGRNFYEGPAARTDSWVTTFQKTKVPCRMDHMGKGFIVYPQT